MILKVGLVTSALVSIGQSDHFDDYDYYAYDYNYDYDYDYYNYIYYYDSYDYDSYDYEEYYQWLLEYYEEFYQDFEYELHWIDESTYEFNGSGFRVLSGHEFCRVESDGCVSTGLHTHYRNNERCEFEWVGPGVISAESFDVEESFHSHCAFDHLTVESTGEKFCGDEAPMNFRVVTSEKFTWSTDYAIMKDGFRMCGVVGDGTTAGETDDTTTGETDDTTPEEPVEVLNCELSQWSDWGDCDDVCAGGMRRRTREITQNPTPGGEACPADAVFEEEEACNEDIECELCEDVIIHTGDFGGAMVWSMADFRGNTCESISYDENQFEYIQECCMRIGDFVALDLKSITGSGWQGGSMTVFGQQFTMESGSMDMRNLRWEKPPTETPADMIPLCERVNQEGRCKDDCAYVFDDPDFPSDLIPNSLFADVCLGTQGLYTFQCPTECHTREDMRELCHVVKQRDRCDEPCGWVLADPDLTAIIPDHVTTALCLGEGVKYTQLCPTECQMPTE